MGWIVASLYIGSFLAGAFVGGMIMREVMHLALMRQIKKFSNVVHLDRRA